MSDPQRPKPLTRRRRATVGGLLGLVASIALGLGAYRHSEPWFLARRAHPQFAPVSALFDRSPECLRCAACHGQAGSPSWAMPTELAAMSPHGPNQMLNCTNCHAR